MIISLKEMLQLTNFGHMTTLKYNLSHVIKFCSDAIGKNYGVIFFTSKYLSFKKA